MTFQVSDKESPTGKRMFFVASRFSRRTAAYLFGTGIVRESMSAQSPRSSDRCATARGRRRKPLEEGDCQSVTDGLHRTPRTVLMLSNPGRRREQIAASKGAIRTSLSSMQETGKPRNGTGFFRWLLR